MSEKEMIHNEEEVTEQTSTESTDNEQAAESDNNNINADSEETTDQSQEVEESETKESETKESETEEITEENDEVTQLKNRIQELEQQIEERENRILRLQADFDNYRKRIRNEMDANEKYQSQHLAKELLTSLDNFERALKTEVTTEEGKSILEGMEMVYKSILSAFEKEGITQIEAVGKEFDPNLHHAVMQGQDENFDSNIVIEEFQKGYMLKDRVIRPAMVKVNQ